MRHINAPHNFLKVPAAAPGQTCGGVKAITMNHRSAYAINHRNPLAKWGVFAVSGGRRLHFDSINLV
jgi:frataxin-like iron-binding protein CyaY